MVWIHGINSEVIDTLVTQPTSGGDIGDILGKCQCSANLLLGLEIKQDRQAIRYRVENYAACRKNCAHHAHSV